MGETPIAELTEAPGGRPRRRRALAVAALVVVGAVVVAIIGFTRRDSRRHPIKVSLRAIAAASYEPVKVHSVSESDGATITFDGVLDFEHMAAEFTSVEVRNGKTSRFTMKMVDGTSYSDPRFLIDTFRNPEFASANQGPTDAQVAEYLHGRHWLMFDIKRPNRPSTTHTTEDFTSAMNVQMLGQLGGNVAAPLQQLAEAGINPVDLGGDTIAGTPVEHLQLKYSNHDLYPHSTDDLSNSPVTTLDLWIDDTNHERRAEITKPAWHDASSSSPAEHSVTDFSDYGTGIHVDAPDLSDTVSFSDFNHWIEQFYFHAIPAPPPDGLRITGTTTTIP